jgi:ferric-dicitrate binding protein FerR (iron transport regulator)
MNEQIKHILLRSLREKISAEEQSLLENWADTSPENQALLNELRDPEVVAGYLEQMERYDAKKALNRLRAHFDEKEAKKPSLVYRLRWTAAAIFLLVAGSATWYVLQQDKYHAAALVYSGNVMPGRDGARLRLSNGTIITIDSLADGFIAKDGDQRIFKKNGRIVYEGKAGNNIQAIIYNEIIADNGRKITAELPDGSTVWLNAGSSIRYPLQFTGDERLISMTGEASFRVVHNNKQPFRVIVKKQLVEDIGTEFNINAYDDEEVVRTTLVEGIASVSAGGMKVILDKGLEAVNRNGSLQSGKGNIEKAIAWRNGLFSFDHADLKTVLRQFVRWYDVEVRYDGNVPNETFTGEMERNLTLADALDNLKRMRVRFRIEEDKRIVVLP